MKTILTTALLLLLCSHWHHQRKESIKQYIEQRIGTDTDCIEALEEAKVRYNLSEEEVKQWEQALYL